MNFQLALSKSMMFPLPPLIEGMWWTCDVPPTWNWMLLKDDQIQIGVAGVTVRGVVQRHGSILTFRLAGSKPLVAYASMQDGVLELLFVTMKLSFVQEPDVELSS
jgi:hypothetical protein